MGGINHLQLLIQERDEDRVQKQVLLLLIIVFWCLQYLYPDERGVCSYISAGIICNTDLLASGLPDGPRGNEGWLLFLRKKKGTLGQSS